MSHSTEPSADVADRPEAGLASAALGVSLAKFRDPLQIPPVLRPRGPGSLTVRMQTALVRLHSELPPTRVWTYEGSFPGPTIEVQRGERLRVAWKNELTGPIPLTAVEVSRDAQQPGRQDAPARADVAALPPWTVVHLHGAVTGGGNDGWPDNGVSPGAAQLAEYPNDQPSGTFWYHDHAMAITRWNVFAGLAGMYLIRDEEEDALRLPDHAQEVPLILCDRNLDVGPDGRLTGQLLYKVGIFVTHPQKLTFPFTGPFTLVNGTIWPHMRVARRWYRFRVLNSSNARTYQLELRAQDGTALTGVLKQIGTDSGLLPAPLVLNRLILAPGERADVLVDFAPFGGQSLTLVNTLNLPPEPGTTTPNPDIMQFRVRTVPGPDRFVLPTRLSPSFVRLDHNTVAHGHRWLVLTPPGPEHPSIWEMVEVDPATVTIPGDGIVQVQHADGTVRTLRRVARRLRDTVNFIIKRDSWEQWSILHLGGPGMHPMHIHLVRFQALARAQYDVTGFDALLGGTTRPVAPTGAGGLDPNEQGWKDVIRVDPGQLVRVLGQFRGATGQFMYHCHVLEHEDENMMRPFVVLPPEVMAVDPHTGGGGHDHDTSS